MNVGLDGLGGLLLVAAIAVGQLARARGRGSRRARERVAAVAPIVRREPAPTEPPVAKARPASAVARLPKRVETAAAPHPAPHPAPVPLTGPRIGGPRWAANAFVAAEVFGPPVADRPGGTLGPPNAF